MNAPIVSPKRVPVLAGVALHRFSAAGKTVFALQFGVGVQAQVGLGLWGLGSHPPWVAAVLHRFGAACKTVRALRFGVGLHSVMRNLEVLLVVLMLNYLGGLLMKTLSLISKMMIS